MSLYSKKLRIKKPNNQIQIANLYTDKNDVGSNYLTLNDNNNIVYAPLMNNGDIDCKINKNNQIFKVCSFVNGRATINFTKRGTHDNITEYYPQIFTVPDNVHVVNIVFTSCSLDSIMGLGNCSISEIIKVTPNKTYTCQYSECVDVSNKYHKVDVTIYFASLKFTTHYFANDRRWIYSRDSFSIFWYVNGFTPKYSAD